MIYEKINNKIYFFKLGQKWLIPLKDFLYNIEDQESLLKHLFYLLIDDKHEWEQVYEACPDAYNIILLSLKFSFNLDGSLEDIIQYILQMDLSKMDELYSILVGEIGVPPTEFYQMTPHEAELAYHGFLKRKELQANLNLISICEALQSDQVSPIVLLQDLGYRKSSLEERERTFKKLNLEDDYGLK